MPDKITLTIDLPSEVHHQIEDLAHRRGFDEIRDYLLALAESDARGEVAFNEEDDEEVDIEANFRQAWHEAMTGQVYPIEKLWEMVDGENKPSIEFDRQIIRDIKQLEKNHPHIRRDINAFIDLLGSGSLPGDQVRGIGYTVYKVRLKSTDLTKGKSGGYRLIYYVRTPTQLILLTIYAKSERADMPAKRIRQIIEDYQRNKPK